MSQESDGFVIFDVPQDYSLCTFTDVCNSRQVYASYLLSVISNFSDILPVIVLPSVRGFVKFKIKNSNECN